MSDTHPSPKSQPLDIVALFEPARAALRPIKCSGIPRCWVTCGPKAISTGFPPACLACNGKVNLVGNEALHRRELIRCIAARAACRAQ